MIGLLAMIAMTATTMDAGPATDRLACAVRPGWIDITLPASLDPSIGSIAVVHGGRWHIVVDDGHRFAPYRAGLRKLSLSRKGQKAVVYRDGRERVVRAFSAPGAYRIVFADNLETEPENMTSLSCDVRLR